MAEGMSPHQRLRKLDNAQTILSAARSSAYGVKTLSLAANLMLSSQSVVPYQYTNHSDLQTARSPAVSDTTPSTKKATSYPGRNNSIQHIDDGPATPFGISIVPSARGGEQPDDPAESTRALVERWVAWNAEVKRRREAALAQNQAFSPSRLDADAEHLVGMMQDMRLRIVRRASCCELPPRRRRRGGSGGGGQGSNEDDDEGEEETDEKNGDDDGGRAAAGAALPSAAGAGVGPRQPPSTLYERAAHRAATRRRASLQFVQHDGEGNGFNEMLACRPRGLVPMPQTRTGPSSLPRGTRISNAGGGSGGCAYNTPRAHFALTEGGTAWTASDSAPTTPCATPARVSASAVATVVAAVVAAAATAKDADVSEISIAKSAKSAPMLAVRRSPSSPCSPALAMPTSPTSPSQLEAHSLLQHARSDRHLAAAGGTQHAGVTQHAGGTPHAGGTQHAVGRHDIVAVTGAANNDQWEGGVEVWPGGCSPSERGAPPALVGVDEDFGGVENHAISPTLQARTMFIGRKSRRSSSSVAADPVRSVRQSHSGGEGRLRHASESCADQSTQRSSPGDLYPHHHPCAVEASCGGRAGGSSSVEDSVSNLMMRAQSLPGPRRCTFSTSDTTSGGGSSRGGGGGGGGGGPVIGSISSMGRKGAQHLQVAGAAAATAAAAQGGRAEMPGDAFRSKSLEHNLLSRGAAPPRMPRDSAEGGRAGGLGVTAARWPSSSTSAGGSGGGGGGWGWSDGTKVSATADGKKSASREVEAGSSLGGIINSLAARLKKLRVFTKDKAGRKLKE